MCHFSHLHSMNFEVLITSRSFNGAPFQYSSNANMDSLVVYLLFSVWKISLSIVIWWKHWNMCVVSYIIDVKFNYRLQIMIVHSIYELDLFHLFFIFWCNLHSLFCLLNCWRTNWWVECSIFWIVYFGCHGDCSSMILTTCKCKDFMTFHGGLEGMLLHPMSMWTI